MAKGDAAYLVFDDETLHFEAVTNEVTENVSEVTEHAVELGADVADHVRVKNPRVSLTVLVSNTPIRDVNGWYGETNASEELPVPTARKQAKTVQLDVPTVSKPLIPTPGALASAAFAAVDSLLSGAQSYSVSYDELVGYVEQTVTAQVRRFPGLANGRSVVQDVMDRLEDWRQNAVLGQVFLPWGVYENVIITKVTPKRVPSTGDAAEITIDLQGVRLVESKLVTAPLPTEDRGKVAAKKGRQPTSFVRDPPRKKALLKKLRG